MLQQLQFLMNLKRKTDTGNSKIMVQINRNIYYDLYCKDADTHQYLKFHSYHPSHTKRNIPFNLAKRICTIVSYPELRTEQLKVLKIYFKQHYLENRIDGGVNKSLNIPLTELRETKPKEDQNHDNIPFVVTNNPKNHNLLGSPNDSFQSWNNPII